MTISGAKILILINNIPLNKRSYSLRIAGPRQHFKLHISFSFLVQVNGVHGEKIHFKCSGCKNRNYKLCYVSSCILGAIFASKYCSSFLLSILHPIVAATFGCCFCINQVQLVLFTYFATNSCSRFWLMYLHLLGAQGP